MLHLGCLTLLRSPIVRKAHLYLSTTNTLLYRAESTQAMELSKVVQKLHKMASPSLAGSWDNVGLLVEPSAPHNVSTVLITNDLTPPVLDEAVSKGANMIISYHPPIFAPLKRLTQRKWKEQIVVKCIEKRIAVFSPHTSHDCLKDGINDWLISCFETEGVVQAVEKHEELPSNHTHTVSFDMSAASVDGLKQDLKKLNNQAELTDCSERSDRMTHIEVLAGASSLVSVMDIVERQTTNIQHLQTTALSKVPKPGYGMGRKAKLKTPLTVDDAAKLVKTHLKLDKIRVAKPPGVSTVSSVAVCAGSGGSVLRDVKADLYVTGEMSHHELLHAVYGTGATVILAEHSNSERGYLTVLAGRLAEALKQGEGANLVKVIVSQEDRDPVEIM